MLECWLAMKDMMKIKGGLGWGGPDIRRIERKKKKKRVLTCIYEIGPGGDDGGGLIFLYRKVDLPLFFFVFIISLFSSSSSSSSSFQNASLRLGARTTTPKISSTPYSDLLPFFFIHPRGVTGLFRFFFSFFISHIIFLFHDMGPSFFFLYYFFYSFQGPSSSRWVCVLLMMAPENAKNFYTHVHVSKEKREQWR